MHSGGIAGKQEKGAWWSWICLPNPANLKLALYYGMGNTKTKGGTHTLLPEQYVTHCACLKKENMSYIYMFKTKWL